MSSREKMTNIMYGGRGREFSGRNDSTQIEVDLSWNSVFICVFFQCQRRSTQFRQISLWKPRISLPSSQRRSAQFWQISRWKPRIEQPLSGRTGMWQRLICWRKRMSVSTGNYVQLLSLLLSEFYRKHRCPVSLLIVRSQKLSWNQVLNCKNCNQCLKCLRSLGL